MATAITPVYQTPAPNDDVVLYEGNLRVTWPGGVADGEGQLICGWLPSPEIRFQMKREVAGPSEVPMFPVPLEVELVDKRSSTVGYNVGYESTGSGPTSYRETIYGILEKTKLGDSTRLSRLETHIPNFPYFQGGSLDSSDGLARSRWGGRLELQADAWEVVIDPVRNHRELARMLGRQGGFGLTAVCQVQQKDESTFSMDEAADVLRALWLFASFLRGAWTSPILSVGYEGEIKACELWDVPFMHDWRARQSCIPEDIRQTDASGDRIRGPKVSPIFERIFSLQQNADWREPLSWLIGWYVRANMSRNAEVALMLAQSGLELLAWCLSVLKGSISQNAFKDLRAAGQIEELLKLSSVGIAVPGEPMMNDLVLISQDPSEQDPGNPGPLSGPAVLTRIRNRVVHPPKGPGRPSQDARIEAFQLGLWYLELALMNLFDYRDAFASRLRSWLQEKPPWI